MLERLGWTVSIFLFFWLANQWFRICQRRRLHAITRPATKGATSLIVVVSSRCTICPAQKKIVAQLCERYPPSLLRVVIIDAETQMEQVRELSVITVPTTLLQTPYGSIVRINNGFIALAPLARQIDDLILRNTRLQ